MYDGVDSGAECQGRGDDLVTRLNARSEQRQMQGGGAGIQRCSVWAALVASDLRLKEGCPRSGPQPTATQRGDHLFNLRIFNGGRTEYKKSVLIPDGYKCIPFMLLVYDQAHATISLNLSFSDSSQQSKNNACLIIQWIRHDWTWKCKESRQFWPHGHPLIFLDSPNMR